MVKVFYSELEGCRLNPIGWSTEQRDQPYKKILVDLFDGNYIPVNGQETALGHSKDLYK